MTYMHVDEGRQGAKRQHTKAFDIRLFVAKLMEKFRSITRLEGTEHLMDRVKKDLAAGKESSLRAVCDYSFSNNYNNLQLRRPYVPRAQVAETPEFQQRVNEKAEAIKRKVDANILEQITLPTGKTLYHSTREEIIQYGADFSRLAKKLKPGQTPCEAGLKGF